MFLYSFNHIRVFIVITSQPVNNATVVFAKVCIKTTEYEPYIAVIIIEVLVRQSAIGINFMDVYQRSGLYPLGLPSGIGLEAAGFVEEIGNGVSHVRPGDRVVYSGGPPGSYAECRNVLAARIVKIPDGISDEQAAALILKGTTAEYLLERAYPIKTGEDVLFYAAAGGVGSIAGQWGKALGARMIGIAGGSYIVTSNQ